MLFQRVKEPVSSLRNEKVLDIEGAPGVSDIAQGQGGVSPLGVGVIFVSLPSPSPCSPVEISYKSQLVGNRWPWLTNKPPQAAPPVLGLE